MPEKGLAARYARLLRIGRLFVVLGWLGIAAVTYLYIPPLHARPAQLGLAGTLRGKVPAIAAEVAALRHFAFPLLAEELIVQHRAGGLSHAAQERTVKRALQIDRHQLPGLEQIAGAAPITNLGGIFPASRQASTTAITYLFFRPSLPYPRQLALTDAYARSYLSGPGMGLIGPTGPIAAERAQGTAIVHSLRTVEVVTIALVLIVTALAFRSVLAPLITLAAAGIAYLVSQRVLSLAAIHLGITVPGELDPVIVVLLLGITTDYSVFFLSSFRRELQAGTSRRGSFLRSTTAIAPIVLIAGMTVAASLTVILTAHLSLYSSLGPGLAITVFVTLIVAVSFIPALLAMVGPAAFWPSHPQRGAPPPAPADGVDPDVRRWVRGRHGLRSRLERLTVRKPIAAAVLVVGVAGLLAAAWPLRNATVGINLIGDLPSTSVAGRAAQAASTGFAPGITQPTEVIVYAPGLGGRRAALDRLQLAISHQPGVAGVLGPADQPSAAPAGAFVAKDGTAARYLLILRDRPLSGAAVDRFTELRGRMPALLRAAGLTGARAAYAGDTAISATIVKDSDADLIRVGLFTLGVDLLILVVFLRALLAPVVLIVASALVVAGAFGITDAVFTGMLHQPAFTYYVPFAAEVLLISFGSDYNLYLVGNVWRRTRRLPFRAAIASAGADSAFAINVAGATLACSFAILAVVPLGSFRQLALLMFAGLLIDTFFVRPFLVPAMLALIGRASGWPGHHRAISTEQPVFPVGQDALSVSRPPPADPARPG